MINLFDNVSGKYGAPMGRITYTENPLGESLNLAVTHPHAASGDDRARLESLRAAPLRFYLQRARMTADGAYDSGGAHWGQGLPVYLARSTCDRVQRSFRAPTRYGAILQLREEFPAARVYGEARRSWADETMHRLESSTITEAQLRKARAVLAAAINGRTQSVACTASEARAVIAHVDDLRDRNASPRITGEWCKRGADYLRALTFRKDGALRNNGWTRQFLHGDADVIAGITHFTLYALDCVGDEFRRSWVYVAPVFKAWGPQGDSVIYTSIPWQSGGDGPRIIGRGRHTPKGA